MHLPANQLVALPVVRELAELLVGQLGNDFGAHEGIIHLNQTPGSQRYSGSRHRRDGVFRECAGKQLSFPKGYNSGGVISVMSFL